MVAAYARQPDQGASVIFPRPKKKDIDGRVRALIEVIDAQVLVSEATPVWGEELVSWIRRELELLGPQADTRVIVALAQRHLREFGGRRITGLVNETTRDMLTDTLAQGLGTGETRLQLIERVEEVFDASSTWRAEAIAHTETLRSSNWATTKGHEIAGVAYREWIAVKDGATRDAHVALDGQIAGIAERFRIGGHSALHPGDFGVPALDIRCRCVTAPRLDIKSTRLDPLKVWRLFDARLKPWEKAAKNAFVRGFEKQRTKVLARFDDVFGGMA